MEQDIRKACVFLRTNNNTIPSEVIEFMLQSSLAALKKAETKLPNGHFKIKYSNEDSKANGNEYIVKEIPGELYHYFIVSSEPLTGGGRLAKKYCKIID